MASRKAVALGSCAVLVSASPPISGDESAMDPVFRRNAAPCHANDSQDCTSRYIVRRACEACGSWWAPRGSMGWAHRVCATCASPPPKSQAVNARVIASVHAGN